MLGPNGSDNKYMSKELGEIGELEFLLKASKLGLAVSKPYGDNRKYDFIVDNKTQLLKIQVKASTCDDGQGFGFCASHGAKVKKKYSPADVDFLACFIEPLGMWYIIPCSELNVVKLRINPRSKISKYERFKEAWNLLLN